METLTVNSGVQVVSYSEKAIAVFGNTKPIKDALSAMRGKYNPFLKYPGTGEKAPGWIFSKRQEERVRAFVLSLQSGPTMAERLTSKNYES